MESTPESRTATRTGSSAGNCGHESNAWIRLRYHWRAASGSFGVNESRREGRSRSTQETPFTDPSAPA